jgi:hypothetical protein
VGLRALAVAIVAAVSICAAAAETEESDPVILKIRLLFRDPEGRQPKWECPKNTDPGTETICLRYPNSFTVYVRDVLAGEHLPRMAHAILWLHTFPSKDSDLFAAGVRLPSGAIDVYEWRYFGYSGCALSPDEQRPQNLMTKKIEELQRAGRLPCKDDH